MEKQHNEDYEKFNKIINTPLSKVSLKDLEWAEKQNQFNSYCSKEIFRAEIKKRTKCCQNCDWSEDNNDSREHGCYLSLMLPSGNSGVLCSILHKVKEKNAGKYCKSFKEKRK